MKRHYYRQVSFLVLIGIVMFSATAIYGAEESIVLTTYYPSPYGVYNEMRLYPHHPSVTLCNNTQEGLMYYDDSPTVHTLKICMCKNPPVCDTFGWMPASGYWAASPSNLDNIYNTNSGNVGIGTNNPASEKLQVVGNVYSTNFYKSGNLTAVNNALSLLNATQVGFGSGFTGNDFIGIGKNTAGDIGLSIVKNGVIAGSFSYDEAGGALNNIRVEGDGTTPVALATQDADIYVAVGKRGNFYVQTDPTGSSPKNRMFIRGSDGNVGIGTETPQPPGWPVAVRLGVEGGAIRSNSYRTYFTGADGAGMFWINSGPDEGGAPVSNPGGDNVIGWNNAPGFSGRQVVIMGTTIIGQFPPVPGWARQNLLVSGNVGIGTMGSGYQLELSLDSAAKPNGGDWAAVSDERLKTNIKPLAGALEKITALKGVQFEWRNPEEHASYSGEVRAGFLAQEVEKIFPGFIGEIEASGKDKALTPDGKIESISLPIDFNAYLVEAIKELKEENDALKTRLGEVEKKLK